MVKLHLPYILNLVAIDYSSPKKVWQVFAPLCRRLLFLTGGNLALLFFTIGLAQQLAAQDLQPLPSLAGRVTDQVGVLSARQKGDLTRKLEALDQKTSTELVVVIVETTKPEDIASYSMRLAEKWQIGKAKKDNGVILLVAQKDRRLRIEVGYGLEALLTDARSNQIISNAIVPHFKAGNIYAGIDAGVDRISSVVENGPEILKEEQLQKEIQKKAEEERAAKWRLWSIINDLSYIWMIPCAILGLFFIYFKKPWWGAGLPSLLYGLPMLLLGIFYDSYFMDALIVVPLYLFIFWLFYSIAHSKGGSYSGGSSGGSSYRSSSYSSGSSYSSSSSSSYSSSSSSYSGGGGSFGGGGASGSW